MPSQRRIIYDGAVVHIVQKGNNGQKIFAGEEDYRKLISLIMEYKRKIVFELYNYCLMPNHLHLLLKILKEKDLPKLMQGVFQSFRFYYKRRYKYIGYLYQGRYRSNLIEKNSYLLDCARYIERNPLRAGIVKDLSQYKWSSYLFYAYGSKNDIIIKNPLYDTIANDIIARREAYKEYVLTPRAYEEAIDKEFKII
jgi:putative transposase